MLSVVGALAWLLTVVGVFATTTFAVTSRTREAGIRMALGARAADVMRSLVMDSQRPVVVGILMGTVGAGLLTRLVDGLLYDTPAHDPSVFGAVAAGSVVTSLVAAWLPASRVARIDPVAALRLEER
jgi:ABC-type antimicrobial peptide transport system permease subunit